MPFRFHVIGLPHTQTNKKWCHCAYTAKTWKFIDMMLPRGHEIVHYGNEGSEVSCEHVNLLTEAERSAFFPHDGLKQQAPAYLWDTNNPHWSLFNGRAILELRKRVRPKDFILTLTGSCSKSVGDAFPEHMTVEYGIGYYGTFSKYLVFESNTHREWMHGKKGSTQEDYHDAVVPNYFDVREFPFSKTRGDYYLFLGRLNEDKGWRTALQVVEELRGKIVFAGQGDPGKLPKFAKHVGPVGIEKRGELLSRAIASFAPTRYREPFGGVAVEAQLCGTPCITTDHGAFVETVRPEWRCANFREFVAAAERAKKLFSVERETLRLNAQLRYGFATVAPLYERYFQRIYDLWGAGFYADAPGRRSARRVHLVRAV